MKVSFPSWPKVSRHFPSAVATSIPATTCQGQIGKGSCRRESYFSIGGIGGEEIK